MILTEFGETEELKSDNYLEEVKDFTFEDAMSFIKKVSVSGIIMGTVRIMRLLDELGNPQNSLKVIHVAGTNGKGSTVAMLSTILKEAGYRVGRYISPTLVTYLERIQINGEYITESEFADVTKRVSVACERMVAAGYSCPTVYEVETVIALLYFKETGCDFVVMECLMGGRDDATNVCSNTLMCVFASIGRDHMGMLGPTIADIARNKAGIIKKNSVVVSIKQEPEVAEVIKEVADNFGCKLYVADPDAEVSNVRFNIGNTSYNHNKYGEVTLSLNGSYQIKNSLLVIKCIDVLKEMGYNISQTAMLSALHDTNWFGRMTKLGDKPLFFVDGAHNEPAARELSDTVHRYFTKDFLHGRKLVFIMGVFKDKEYEKIIDIMASKADHIFTIQTPENERAMDEGMLASVINDRVGKVLATPCSSISVAVKAAIEYNNGNVCVVAFGSLSHLDLIRKEYNLYG